MFRAIQPLRSGLLKGVAVALLALAVMSLFCARPAAATAARDEATKLHVVLLGYTGANDIGPACHQDVQAVKQFFAKALGELPGERVQFHDLTGEAWTPAKVLAALRQLPVGPNDNILLYHSGHGAMCKEGSCLGHFLKLDKAYVARNDVRDVLKKLRPRGLILLTDCCSACGNASLLPRGGRERAAPGLNVESVRNLFLGAKGLVDITAALDGDTAQADHIGPNVAGAQSAFTVALLNLLSDRSQTFTAWQGFFAKLSRETLVSSNGAHQARAFTLNGALAY